MINYQLDFIAQQQISIAWGTYVVQAITKKQSFIAYHAVPKVGVRINGDDITVSTKYYDSKLEALESVLDMASKFGEE